MNIGALEFEFLANIARLRQDMEEAKKAVGGASEFIKGVVDGAGKALVGLAAGLSVNAFASWIKGAINAADAMDEMSGRLGIGAAELTKLNLAYKLSGMSQEDMQSSLAKLSKAIGEGNEAFDKLGIKTRNTDGTLRSADKVLRDVADSFKGMEDGTQKTVLAMEIFGKSGANMVDLLNKGSEGLDEMASMAEKLGIVMDDETAASAAKFNDTLDFLHLAFQGIATQVAAKMLPALNSISESFLSYITEGDMVRRVSEGITTALKVLYSAGILIVEVFSTVGKTVGAAIGQVVAIMNGDFKLAMGIGKEWSEDVKQGWTQSAKALSDAWDDSGGKTVEALSTVQKAGKSVELQTNAQKKAAEEAQKAYESWASKLRDAAADMRYNLDEGEKMTAAQKLLAQLTANNTAEVQKLTDKRRAELIEMAKQNVATEEEIKARDLARKAMEESGKENDKFTDGIQKKTDAIWKQVQQTKDENAMILLNKEQLAALEQQKLLDAAAQAERNAQDAESQMLGSELVDEYKRQAEGLRELAKLKGDKVHLEAAKEAQEAWAKVSETIGQGLTDSLYRAFESGKNFWSTLWDGIKNTVKSTVLKVVIQGTDGKGGIAGSILGAIGMGGSSAGGSSGGGLSDLIGGLFGSSGGSGGGLGSLGGLFSGMGSTFGGWMQSAGDWLSGGLGNLGTGPFAELGGWLSSIGQGLGSVSGLSGGLGSIGSALGGIASAVSAISDISKGAWGSAIGTGVGAYFGGPIGATIGSAIGKAVDKLFGGNGTHHAGAGYVSNGSTGMDVKNGGYGLDWSYGDSVGKYFSQDVQNALKTITAGSAGILNDLSKTFGGKGGYQVGAYFASDNDRASQGGRSVLLNGKVLSQWGGSGLDKDPTKGLQQLTDALAGQVKAAISTIDIPAWAQKQIDALGTNATLEQIANVAGAIIKMQAQMQMLPNVLNPLGGIFSDIAKASESARSNLVGLAGSIDNLVALSQQFATDYYTKEEQAGLQARAIMNAFSSLGIDGATLGSREDFRALVESLGTKIEDANAQKQLVGLLQLGPQFAQLADYMKENTLTLAQAADSAPQVEALQALVNNQDASNEAQTRIADGQEQTNTLLGDIFQGITAGNAAIVDAVSFVGDALYDFSNGLAEAQGRPIVAMER